MKVIKRDGRQEDVSFDKVIRRLQHLCSGHTSDGRTFGPQLNVDIIPLAQKVINQIHDNITTRELDEFAASTCNDLVLEHPDYSKLAGRIIISNHHKNTLNFVATIKLLYQNTDTQGQPNPLVSSTTYKTVIENKQFFDEMVDDLRDFRFNYFAFKTLERSYLLKSKSGHLTVHERPQHLWARVAIGIHGNDLPAIKQTYDLLSHGKIMHATPTLFNSGRPTNQFSSCFLVDMEDSIEGIYETLKKCALISKNAGGIGVTASAVRAKRSLIRGTHGVSDGIVPMLKVCDQTANYVNQGGKRKGSFAIYLEPWHADILEFLDLRKTHGNLDFRANYLFYALWVPDLFWQRLQHSIKNNDPSVTWSLMCPDECPGLIDAYGQDFTILYEKYEREGKYRKQIKIQELYKRIAGSQKETDTPYILHKDNVNRKSNQKNIGTIKSSNLCVSGDTPILTKEGYFPIQTLVDQEMEIWNGQFFSSSLVKKTNTNQQLMELQFSNGAILRCTPYHKFYLQPSHNEPVQVTAEELSPEHILLQPESFPTLFEGDEYAYYNGEEIPVNAPIRQKLRWFENYINQNGLLVNNRISIRLQPTEQKLKILDQIRLLLTTLSTSPILDREKATLQLYPKDVQTLRNLGLNSQILSNTLLSNINTDPQPPLHLVRKTLLEEPMDTYCFNEPIRHMGVFNGILTGNCAEIVEYSDAKENLIAVCNLASVPVNEYVQIPDTASTAPTGSVSPDGRSLPTYDHEGLGKAVEVLTENLNKIIDINYYPVEDCKTSNFRDRPIGIGVQGLADAFILMRYPFDSPEARKLNREIAETMYYYAIKTSVRLAKESQPYQTYEGSPASQGVFHWEMWNEERQSRNLPPIELSGRYDWEALRQEMTTHGLRNSLLLAMMPTASTAQILGNNECFEPFTYNVYVRRVLSGEFKIVNPHMLKDLTERNLWTKEIQRQVVANKGSVQNISEIPQDLKDLYKTAFEIKPSALMNLAIDRQAFTDQSQSMNLFISNPDDALLTTVHLYGWEQGLKTGQYYLRREQISSAQQFTVKPVKRFAPKTTTPPSSSTSEPQLCTKDDPDCLACQG